MVIMMMMMMMIMMMMMMMMMVMVMVMMMLMLMVIKNFNMFKHFFTLSRSLFLMSLLTLVTMFLPKTPEGRKRKNQKLLLRPLC